jgi:hypothetical protein
MFVDIIKPIHSLVQNYNMRRLFISIYFITGILFCSYSQTVSTSRTLSGKVVDVYGQPIEGVEIKAKGSSVAVYSNESGAFELAGNSSSVLTFSRKGYDVVNVKGGNKKSLTIQLVENYIKNPEKADVLYDVKSKDKILGSISTVYTSQLVTSPDNFYSRLANRFNQKTISGPSTTTDNVLQLAELFNTFDIELAVLGCAAFLCGANHHSAWEVLLAAIPFGLRYTSDVDAYDYIHQLLLSRQLLLD